MKDRQLNRFLFTQQSSSAFVKTRYSAGHCVWKRVIPICRCICVCIYIHLTAPFTWRSVQKRNREKEKERNLSINISVTSILEASFLDHEPRRYSPPRTPHCPDLYLALAIAEQIRTRRHRNSGEHAHSPSSNRRATRMAPTPRGKARKTRVWV